MTLLMPIYVLESIFLKTFTFVNALLFEDDLLIKLIFKKNNLITHLSNVFT